MAYQEVSFNKMNICFNRPKLFIVGLMKWIFLFIIIVGMGIGLGVAIHLCCCSNSSDGAKEKDDQFHGSQN